jgi:hypothetical protein
MLEYPFHLEQLDLQSGLDLGQPVAPRLAARDTEARVHCVERLLGEL